MYYKYTILILVSEKIVFIKAEMYWLATMQKISGVRQSLPNQLTHPPGTRRQTVL